MVDSMKKKKKNPIKTISFIALAVLLFCILFLDDITILSTVVLHRGTGAPATQFVWGIVIYMLLFLFLPALSGVIVGAVVAVKAFLDKDGSSCKFFGIITAIELLVVLIVLLITIYLLNISH